MSEIKKQLFEQLALITQSLASPQRIELLDYLAQAERSVDELSQLTSLSTANTSRHLQILKQNGLVLMRKQGKSRLYKIAGDDVIQLISCLRRTAENHLAEVTRLKQNILPSYIDKEAISSKELLSKMNTCAILLLDVRPLKEFEQGHIKGAVNISPESIEQKINDIPHDKTVVAYCRGPYCAYSYQMVEALRQRGLKALRLEEGFPEWKAAGLPFEINQVV
ncbi:ArsR/SmtB family transcription factor [Thiomicrorhabdus arctica]|uniref:ArsR/SmtB family transcription factor n=1 Tax=Thiomicrorhabdus arctica TaxID=131540 RepID=UPI00037AE5F8|nr:metalloregulator ArsR/SmtB family transcription factor [Thiomicrorhabdus arctica]